MNLTIGHRYVTRAGAIVQVIERIETGLMYRTPKGTPIMPADLFRVRIVKYADGTEAAADYPREYAVHYDGNYGSTDQRGLDVVADVSVLGKAAAE